MASGRPRGPFSIDSPVVRFEPAPRQAIGGHVTFRFIGALCVVSCTLVSAGFAAGRQSSRPATPRIVALEEKALTNAQREILGPYAKSGRTLYLFRACVRTPELCRAWVPSSSYFGTSPLSARDRELLILRTCWLCKNEYTWANHIAGAKRAGLTDDEILRVTQGTRAKGWSSGDALVLLAAEELHADQFIQDSTWKSLSGRYSERELTDAIFIVGQYTFISMWARSGGFPLEQGVPGFPRSPW
jgi:4-carboxymuconolactone decarboxylase